MHEQNIHISLPGRWSGWKVTEILGKGAYASVYRAEDKAGHVSAIKIMKLSEDVKVAETDLMDQFSGLPGIVTVEEQVVENGYLYIRMECLTDLKKWCEGHAVTEKEAVCMLLDLCTALESCEKAGVLHRDIKPGNILVTEEGQCRLCDFGVARMLEQTNPSLTVQGTFAYMAPEVYHGASYDHRADLYSLGLVFYQLMNEGKAPLEGESAGDQREQALKRRMKGVRLPAPVGASPELSEILLKACSFHPYNRYTSAREMKEDLIKLQKGTYRKKKRPFAVWGAMSRTARAAAAVLVVMLTAGLSLSLWSWYPVIYKESCGPGTFLTLHRNGTLVISGDGAMSPVDVPDVDLLNQESTVSQLLKHRDEVKKVTVKNGVKYVNLSGVAFPNLEKVTLSDSVAAVRELSFSECHNLKSVTFLGQDTELGEYVFSKCYALQRIALPRHLTSVPKGLLEDCRHLEDIEIPETVTEIGENAFFETPWLEHLKKDSDYVMVNDVLLAYCGDEDKITIGEEQGIHSITGQAFSKSSIRQIVMEDCVRTIGEGAFEGSDLEEVVLPAGLKRLPKRLFNDCSRLTTVELPKDLEALEDNIFQGCTSLTELKLPSSVTSTGWNIFEQTPLKEKKTKDGYTIIDGILIAWNGDEEDLVIPEELGITGIGASAFEGQMQLKSIQLPEGITWLGDKVFFMCQNLEEITFPESLRFIGRGAMSATPWWERQHQENTFTIINDMLVEYHGNDEVLVIPKELPVTKIMPGCFMNMNIREITIPDQVTSISEDSFTRCDSLVMVHLPDTFSEEEIRKVFADTPWYYLR